MPAAELDIRNLSAGYGQTHDSAGAECDLQRCCHAAGLSRGGGPNIALGGGIHAECPCQD